MVELSILGLSQVSVTHMTSYPTLSAVNESILYLRLWAFMCSRLSLLVEVLNIVEVELASDVVVVLLDVLESGPGLVSMSFPSTSIRVDTRMRNIMLMELWVEVLVSLVLHL